MVVALGFTVLVAVFVAWLTLGGGVWRGGARVVDAVLRSPTRLELFVDSCQGNPKLTLLRETDVDVQVRVVASSTPLRGGRDCLDHFEVQLQEPLGARVVVDKHTGHSVKVSMAVPAPSEPAATPSVAGSFETQPSPTRPATTPASARYFDETFALKLVVDPEVRQGERLQGLDVIFTNEGSEPFTFFYSGNLLDFEVLDGAGDVIWKYLAFHVDPLGTFTLAPGESAAASELGWASQGQWDLRDREGFPVEPGMYQVRGVLTFHLQDPAEGGREQRLETTLQPLTVRQAPLPDYARIIKLELVAPQEVRPGETVPFDLRFTNVGQRPVVLWWSGRNQIPRLHHSDIIVFRDGAPVWRVVDANDIRGSGTVTLGPGESRSLSEIRFVAPGGSFNGSGKPWEWDQRADCGKYRYVPCEQPVEPGIYTVRGAINVSPPETLNQVPPFTPERTALVTESHQLTITR